MIRILFSDLDGTLVEERSSWRLVHRFLGTDHIAARALERFSRGEITYEEFVKHDLNLWPKGLQKSFFEYIFSKVRIRPSAKNLFKQLKDLGVKRVIVTSGLNILAERICRELEADECVSNEMVFDEKGLFTGNVIVSVNPSNKAKVIQDICRKYSIPLEDSVAIGDTEYDESMFRITGLSILLLYKEQEQSILSKKFRASYVVNSLEEAASILINLIEKERGVK